MMITGMEMEKKNDHPSHKTRLKILKQEHFLFNILTLVYPFIEGIINRKPLVFFFFLFEKKQKKSMMF